MPASIARSGNARRAAKKATRLWRPRLPVVALASLVLVATVPGRADATSLGDLALDWAETTAAHALKAAEPTNDLTVGGLAALNRSVAGGLDTLDHLVPGWLGRIDVDVSFQNDLRPRYRVATTQPFARLHGGRDVLALRGRLGYEPSGAAHGRLGLGYRRDDEDALEVRLGAGLDEQWRTGRDRYVVEMAVDWAALDVHGMAFNEVPADRAPGADPFATWVDGYEIDLEAQPPFLPWTGIRARRSWQRRDGEQRWRDRLSLRLRPIAALSLETGVDDGSDRARDWFAEIRLELAFGPN